MRPFSTLKISTEKEQVEPVEDPLKISLIETSCALHNNPFLFAFQHEAAPSSMLLCENIPYDEVLSAPSFCQDTKVPVLQQFQASKGQKDGRKHFETAARESQFEYFAKSRRRSLGCAQSHAEKDFHDVAPKLGGENNFSHIVQVIYN